MDLFSGSFGCFKPVIKDAKEELETKQKTKETIKVWVLRCNRTGRVHYLEAYNDFVDVLLGFLMLRTGALIRLNREVSHTVTQAKTSGGIYGVYDSFKRLDDSVVLVDKDILLDPYERLKVSEELLALDSGDFECCNADCFKYMSGSRQICRSCTIATHFSCVTCGGYFQENAHTSLCYTPWRPWRNHMTAAPILTRYTVIQSCPPTANKPKKEGYVRKNLPFIITNELTITPLSTSNLSEVLRNCGASSCDDLECNELSIGRSEVLLLLGAALTSPTPLTDIFGKMCNKRTRVSSSGSCASFSQSPPSDGRSKCDGQDGSSIERSNPITPSEVPPCEKKSKPQDRDDSSIKRPLSITCSKVPPCEKSKSDDSSFKRLTSITSSKVPSSKNSKFKDHDDDSSIKRPTFITSSKFLPSKDSKFKDHDDSFVKIPTSITASKASLSKKSKSQDHDSSSFTIWRPKSITCSALPPYERTSKFYDSDDSSVGRETSIVKYAMMHLENPPDQSPRQPSRQSPLPQPIKEQRDADVLSECTPWGSSLSKESPQRQKVVDAPIECTSWGSSFSEESAQQQRVMDAPTECIPLGSSFRKESPQQQRVVDAPTESTPWGSSFRKESPQQRSVVDAPTECTSWGSSFRKESPQQKRVVDASTESTPRGSSFRKESPQQQRVVDAPTESTSWGLSFRKESPEQKRVVDAPTESTPWGSSFRKESPQQQRVVDAPTECTSWGSSFRKESPQRQRAVDASAEHTPYRSPFTKERPRKQIPRKISFQLEPQPEIQPEPQSNCLSGVCPSPPRSPRAIESESSFIELSNFGMLPQQHLPRKASRTPTSSRSSTPESLSREQRACLIRRPVMSTQQVPQQAPLTRRPVMSTQQVPQQAPLTRRPAMSTQQVPQQAPLTRRPGSQCPIDDCFQVSSESLPPQSSSMSISNPLYQQVSPSNKRCFPKPHQPPLQASPPSNIKNEVFPCIARQSRNVNNVRPGPTIVHRKLSPARFQPDPSNFKPAIYFRKRAAPTGISSLISVAKAFEQYPERSSTNSEVGSTRSGSTKFSDDSTPD